MAKACSIRAVVASAGSAIGEALGHPRAGTRGSSACEIAEDGDGQQPQRKRDLGAEARAVDQHQARDPFRLENQHLQGDRAAERVADHVHWPLLAEGVERLEHAARQHLQRCAFGRAGREPATGQVEGDHPVGPGQARVLRGPVLQTATDAVQQHGRRVGRVALDSNPGPSADDGDHGRGAHPAAGSSERTVTWVNRRAGSSIGSLPSSDAVVLVVLGDPPGAVRALLREQVHGSVDVPGCPSR